MSRKYGQCYCGDCKNYNKCRTDKKRLSLISEGCEEFEPDDLCKADYPVLEYSDSWLIEQLEIMQKMIEWDYPLNFQLVIDKVIERLKSL